MWRRKWEKGCDTHFTDSSLTLCFGTDEAGRRVAKGAQDGSDGQAHVLVTRVKSHRGEAEVRQLRGFLRTDLHMRDLREGGRTVTVGRKRKGKEVSTASGVLQASFRSIFMLEI